MAKQRITAQAGHFYAVGVGPGDPELVTLQAARLIESADVIVAPQSKNSQTSLALAAVEDFLHDKEIIVLRYPMTRENDKTRQRWGELATQVAELCQQGKAVVQVTLGDPPDLCDQFLSAGCPGRITTAGDAAPDPRH